MLQSKIDNKIFVRIKGGLGNQLFCYAAARRLAIANSAELVIDDVTGFVRDSQYFRKYALDHFRIPCRKATHGERLEPFERYRRGMLKWLSRRKPFSERRYLEQEKQEFDERLLGLKLTGTLYLDGYWQSEGYFKDIEQTIRKDLLIIPPEDELNQQMSEKIRSTNAVAVHVRWFDEPGRPELNNASADYYLRAISSIEHKTNLPSYFLFSDDSDAARAKLALPEDRVTYVGHNRGDENAYADLWLMSQCRHFIIANSSFSWWGAWLSETRGGIIIAPDFKVNGITSWGFKGLVPDSWLLVG